YCSSDLLLMQLKNSLIQSSFGLKPEVELLIDLQYQTRDIGYTIIPLERFKAQATVAGEEIVEFYEKNKELYIAPEKVKLAYLELSLPDFMNQLQVTDDELLAFYQTRKSYYTSPELVNVRHILVAAPKDSDADKSGEARAKAEDLLAQVKLGEDFSKLAKQFSDDEDT